MPHTPATGAFGSVCSSAWRCSDAQRRAHGERQWTGSGSKGGLLRSLGSGDPGARTSPGSSKDAGGQALGTSRTQSPGTRTRVSGDRLMPGAWTGVRYCARCSTSLHLFQGKGKSPPAAEPGSQVSTRPQCLAQFWGALREAGATALSSSDYRSCPQSSGVLWRGAAPRSQGVMLRLEGWRHRAGRQRVGRKVEAWKGLGRGEKPLPARLVQGVLRFFLSHSSPTAVWGSCMKAAGAGAAAPHLL